MSLNKYEAVIGLEIHIQLNTKRKMFCDCSNDTWKKPPNTVVCPVCLGLPGALPVPNKKAIEYCQLLGLALNCKLNNKSNFDRKHYFYPDLPKGYQISQYKTPFCYDGFVLIDGEKIRIRRIHLEEDTGKSLHLENSDETYLDYNKSGIPLVELVTEPDIKSPEQAEKVGRFVASVAKYLNISNVNMERGNLRLEPSVSVRLLGEKSLPKYRVELKNINSFRFMKQALKYEISRQIKCLEQGINLKQETRGWNESKQRTFTQRVKEQEQEYRYFPEPDIPPFYFNSVYFNTLKKKLPKSEDNLHQELSKKYKIELSKVKELFRIKRWVFVEDLIKYGVDPIKAANIILSSSKESLKIISTSPKEYVNKLKEKEQKSINSEKDLEVFVNQAIKENPNSVQDYKKGKEAALNFLLGQVMRLSKGQANARLVKDLLHKKLKDL